MKSTGKSIKSRPLGKVSKTKSTALKIHHPKSENRAYNCVTVDMKTARTEDQIPRLAKYAVARAAKRARKSGLERVEVVSGKLVSIAPDGTHTVIRNLAPGVAVKIGKQTKVP